MTEEEKADISTEEVPKYKIEKNGAKKLSEKLNVGDINHVFDTTKKALDLARDFFTTIDRILRLFGGDTADIQTLRDREDQPSYNIINYGSKYKGSNDSRAPMPTSSEYNTIEFETYGGAENVLSRMREIIDRESSVSLLQLYDMLKIKVSYTYDDWGWMNLNGVKPRPYHNGYSLNLPPVRRI